MTEYTPSTAGTLSKSDCLVVYRPSKEPVSVTVRSSVGRLFGRSIEDTAKSMLGVFGVKTGLLEIDDDGALNLVLSARIETTLRLAGFELNISLPERDRTFSAAKIQREPSAKQLPRRARLYIPGNQPNLMINADLFGADTLIFDLEDSVPPERKLEARILVRYMLSDTHLFRESELAVRINPIDSSCGREDLEEIVNSRPQAIVLPKCESARDIQVLDVELARLEAREGLPLGSILILPLIETAAGVLAAKEIAAASPRNAALCFGYEDFISDIHSSAGEKNVRSASTPANHAGEMPHSSSQPEALLAKQMIVLAARAAGIDPLDSVISDTEDKEALRSSCEEARVLGMSGKAVIHPVQIPTVKSAFHPSEEEIMQAKAIVEAYERSVVEGKGTAALGDTMIDVPVVERAWRLLNDYRIGD
jgi:citrate lyase subunit beta/citryl-CoA lyase